MLSQRALQSGILTPKPAKPVINKGGSINEPWMFQLEMGLTLEE